MSFDSHCHLTDDAFQEDREEVMARARAAGVEGMVCIASTPADARAALALAEANPDVWCTAGLHPHEAGAAAEGWVDQLRSLLDHPSVVAVGECGLDFHYDFAPRDAQFHVLQAQAALARETGLPLVIHSRNADEEMTAFLRDLPAGVRGVLHCFTGGEELLTAGLDAGWFVSFSGIVTFNKFEGAGAVRRVPADRLLVETDSPYLSPVPERGRRNEPSHLIHTCRRVAEIRGDRLETLAEITRHNAQQFYQLTV